jgi:hypothetical protein
MTGPLTPLMILHPKGGLPASRTWTHYRMAPPIKQENLLAMEDCRLLLKNAVNIKLKASGNVKLEVGELVFCELFFGTCLSICQGLNHQGGGLRGSENHLPYFGQIFVTGFYVGYVVGQLRPTTGTRYTFR